MREEKQKDQTMKTVVVALIVVGSVMLNGCDDETGVPDTTIRSDSVVADADGVMACLGTMYPNKEAINPDNPNYSDSLWSKEEVAKKFATAKSQNMKVYAAYKAGYENSEVLECAFCDCGCNLQPGHLSAADCFKDMHGFT